MAIEPGASGPIHAAVATGRPLFLAWTGLGSALIVELAAEAGADLVNIDLQHGLGGLTEMNACLVAAKAAGIPAVVRVPWNEPGIIGRALDAGADGVISPMINSVEDAKALVKAVKYPPLGMRSFGPIRARLGKPNYLAEANSRTIACAQIETREAIEALDGILAVPGLDMICAGPNDMAMSLRGDTNFRSPEVETALETLLAKCRVHNVIPTIFANDEDYAKAMIAKGWQVVAIGTDAAWIAAAARGVRRAIDGTGQSGLAAPVPGIGGPNEPI